MRWPFLALLVASLSILAVGCCRTPAPEVRYVTNEVRVPVPVPCPAPKLPPRPSLEIEHLAPDAPPKDVAEAYAASVVQLQGYAERLEALLAGYSSGEPAP